MGANPFRESVNEDVLSYEMYGLIESIEDGVYEKHFFLPSEMKFHTSWDWLRPVVEKCLEKHNNLIDGRDVIDTSYSSIAQALQVVSLKETYKAVIEFIKEHNDGR